MGVAPPFPMDLDVQTVMLYPPHCPSLRTFASYMWACWEYEKIPGWKTPERLASRWNGLTDLTLHLLDASSSDQAVRRRRTACRHDRAVAAAAAATTGAAL